MKKILLPNGLNVSEVALGAMMFGSTTSKKESYEVLDTFMDMGGNFIDTSNNYAHWAGTGEREEGQEEGAQARHVLWYCVYAFSEKPVYQKGQNYTDRICGLYRYYRYCADRGSFPRYNLVY